MVVREIGESAAGRKSAFRGRDIFPPDVYGKPPTPSTAHHGHDAPGPERSALDADGTGGENRPGRGHDDSLAALIAARRLRGSESRRFGRVKRPKLRRYFDRYEGSGRGTLAADLGNDSRGGEAENGSEHCDNDVCHALSPSLEFDPYQLEDRF